MRRSATACSAAFGAREQRGVYAGREGAAVRRPRLVVLEIGVEGIGHDFVGEEVVEHEDGGLLHDLRPADHIATEQEIGGDGPGRDVGDPVRNQTEEAGELLVDARVGAVPVRERGREFEPPRPFVGLDVGIVERGGGVGRDPQVPAREHVRVGVVVDGLVVLVGPDDSQDVRGPVRPDPDA